MVGSSVWLMAIVLDSDKENFISESYVGQHCSRIIVIVNMSSSSYNLKHLLIVIRITCSLCSFSDLSDKKLP